MKYRVEPILILLLLLPAAVVQAAAPGSHALLIGVQDYGGTGLRSLAGPVNDVMLLEELLVSRFQVPANQVVTLIDAQATHSGIRSAFSALAGRVMPGDFVYIHYSGHGSQTRDRNGDEGASGLDQTWVSYGARAGRLQGDDDLDVLDDEIIEWLLPLYEKTDRVVFVSDSCHSASVSRGKLPGVRSAAPDPRPHPLAAQRFRRWRAGQAPGVRIGAARDTESAVEARLAGRRFGLFTWYWVQSLEESHPGSTWEDAFKRAYTLVTEKRHGLQRPQLEGSGTGSIFGGDLRAAARTIPVVRVDAVAGRAVIRTGAVNGATVGSVYRAHRPGEPPGVTRAASLELSRVGPYSSEAEISEGTLRAGDLVVETEHAYPFAPVRLRVEADFAEGEDRELVGRLSSMVAELEGFSLAPDRSGANGILYVLRPRRADQGYLFEGGSTLPASDRALPPEVWVLSPQEELVHRRLRVPMEDPIKGIPLLAEHLVKLTRVRELRGLASRSDPPPVAVTVTPLRRAPGCRDRCVPLPDGKGGELLYRRLSNQKLEALARADLRRGDILTFSVANQGHRDYYLYLLNLGPDGGIRAVFPSPAQMREHARLPARETRDLREETGLLLDVAGREALKVIVSREPIDVRLFELEGYREYRQRRGATLNPLERLLAGAMGTRGERIRLRSADWGTLLVEFAVAE